MATFEQAIPVILAHEGTDTNFWVHDPDDLGGETVWGISMLMIKAEGMTPADLGLDIPAFVPGCLKKVSKSTCSGLYRKFFWDKFGYGRIVDQTSATKVFDMCVNAGPTRGAKVAQRAASVTDDGILGPKSIAAINTLGPTFVAKMASEQEKYYRDIVAARPKNAKFLATWLRRAKWGVT